MSGMDESVFETNPVEDTCTGAFKATQLQTRALASLQACNFLSSFTAFSTLSL